MNRIIGYYKNDGSLTTLDNCDYVSIELLGNHAQEENACVLISMQHLPLILECKWFLGADGYAKCYSTIDKKMSFGRSGLKMHKLIFPVSKGYVVDHINRNKLDNRIDNLRKCTYQQNSWNRTKNKNSTNKYKGVKQNTNGTWSAVVCKNGLRNEINNIATEKEAAQIYDYMAEELFGEYAGYNLS